MKKAIEILKSPTFLMTGVGINVGLFLFNIALGLVGQALFNLFCGFLFVFSYWVHIPKDSQ